VRIRTAENIPARINDTTKAQNLVLKASTQDWQVTGVRRSGLL